jgi:hypothetical protein
VGTDTDTCNDTGASKPRVVTLDLNALTALSTLPPGRLLSTPTHEHCYSRVRFGYGGANLQACQVNRVVPTEAKY